MSEMKPGLLGKAQIDVSEDNTARAAGSGTLMVFSTPALLALMEQAAYQALQPHLAQGDTTVGTLADIRHLAATPVGGQIRAEALLTQVEGRRFVFDVRAWDQAGLVGEGRHERVLIHADRFLEKARARQEEPAQTPADR